MKSIRYKLLLILMLGVTTIFAQSHEVTIRVDGLSCPFCAYGLEKKLNDIKGVENININFEEGLVVLQVAEGETISEEELREKIQDAGFTPKEVVFSKKDDSSGGKK